MRHCLWLIATVTLLGAVTVRADNMLRNPGFDGALKTDGLPEGWADNSSWANLEVAYALDRTRPHSAPTSLRIDCPRLTFGAVQMVPDAAVPLRKGGIYRVRGWLRGTVGLVSLQLRLAAAPYTVYAEKALAVSDEWRELSFLWTAGVDDPKGRFMVRFASPGTLWVDDLSVEELTLEEARALQPPPWFGNLLLNGAFDLGPANWLQAVPCDDWRETKLDIVSEQGNPCLQLTVPAGLKAVLNSDVASVSSGHPLRLSCRVRASEKTSVHMGTRGWSRSVDASPIWQTITADLPQSIAPDAVEVFSLYVTGPATVWLDDVELRQDPPGPDRAAHAAIISTRHPLGLYHDGEIPALKLRATVPAGHAPLALWWQVEDYSGAIRAQGREVVSSGGLQRDLPLPKLTRGWYRARVRWTDNGQESINECLFCLLPPAARASAPAVSPFGGHFAVTPMNLKLARAVGCRRLRLHPPNHTKWRVVEPEPGKWEWHDDAIKIALGQGLDLIGSLDRCPDWASSAPPEVKDTAFYTGRSAWLPRDWTEWERYVTETVRRYRNDIHVWEIWNEGNAPTWLVGRPGQSQADAYLELLQHTTPIVRREDPTAQIIAGVTAGPLTNRSPATDFSRELFDKGGLALMDVFSFHEYLSQSVDEGGDPLPQWVLRVRGMMRQAGREVPIINSEGGFYNPASSLTYRPGASDGVSPRTMARWMVRQYVTQLASGVNAFFFYNMFIDGSAVKLAWQGFVDGDGQPSPNVAAYAVMSWLLDGARYSHNRKTPAGVWMPVFHTPGGDLTVAWAPSGKQARVALQGAKSAWDLMGTPLPVPRNGTFTLTETPIYILHAATGPGG